MSTINIPISAEHLTELQKRADREGLSPEEFLQRRVEQMLEATEDSFKRAADHVLKKNAELYRRLS